MKKIILICLFFYASAGFAQTFYQKFPTPLALDYDVAAAEINNGYILGDNESDAASNFHDVIRLFKTDYSGNIIWAKKYDAGSGLSLHLKKLLKTLDNYILAIGYIGPDNNPIASDRYVMKLDTSGSILWSKQYSSLLVLAYNESAIIQVSDTDYVFSLDASSGGNPVLCRIDSSGNVLSAAGFSVSSSSFNGIVLHNNSLDIILKSFYVLNTDLSGGVINWQRQYHNTQQFNSLISNRCANGDLIYIAGQIAGGFGEGSSRIFRTDSLGNLEWSKNIMAWRGSVSNSGTNFDAVSQIAISESANHNIVGVSLEEGGTLLFSVFDSTGNFLYNRNRLAVGQQHFVTETAGGNYLVGSVFGFQSFSTFSSYLLSPGNPCDSILSVSITSGVDSIASAPPVTVSADTVTAANFTLTTTPISISPVVYCNPTGIAEMENTVTNNIFIYPNPAMNTLNVRQDNLQVVQINITNVLGEELLSKTIYNGDNTVNLSEINDGVYFVIISSDKHQLDSKKLIVQKK